MYGMRYPYSWDWYGRKVPRGGAGWELGALREMRANSCIFKNLGRTDTHFAVWQAMSDVVTTTAFVNIVD